MSDFDRKDREQEPLNQEYIYPPYPSSDPAPQKPKKDKKKYSFASLLSVTVCTAILCSALSVGGVMIATRNGINGSADVSSGGTSTTSSQSAGSDTSSQVSNIKITGTVDNVAQAVAQKSGQSVVGIKVTSSSNQFYFGGTSGSTSEGSGVIYSADGYIITNYHVISDAVENADYGSVSSNSEISVYLPSDPETAIPASVVGYDSSADLAVLKIDRTGLPAVEIGNSDELTVGETAIAIGNPGGLQFMGSVSQGIISGLNRSVTTESGTQMNLIQTDAAINPGNSGGALLDDEGKLIGINNSKKADVDYEGMGFAIPVNEVVEITERIIKNENQPQPYLGVSINTSYTSDILNRMGFPSGVVVYSVTSESPAEEAGIQQNDIITKINGTEITSYAQMISEKNKYSAGETITITVYRNGKTIDLSVTLRAGA